MTGPGAKQADMAEGQARQPLTRAARADQHWLNNGSRQCRLSTRELQVLRLFASGRTSKEVAEALFLSLHTVNNHRKNMMAATGCRNIPELVKLVADQGVL